MDPEQIQANIGIFDSGVGGLSVWRELRQCLPGCSSLYLADNAHCPYGQRPQQQIRDFSLAIAQFLVRKGADLVVVACNTASAAALTSLRAALDLPVVGMEPAVKPAAGRTKTGHIGVLATEGTVNGQLFQETSARYAAGATVHVRVGQGLVEIVETGQTYSPQTRELLRQYLDPMLEAGTDQIVLGCTHYSFLVPVIRDIIPEGVSVIDPADAVARQAQRVLLEAASTLSPQSGAENLFFATGGRDELAVLVEKELGHRPRIRAMSWDRGQLVDYQNPSSGKIRTVPGSAGETGERGTTQ